MVKKMDKIQDHDPILELGEDVIQTYDGGSGFTNPTDALFSARAKSSSMMDVFSEIDKDKIEIDPAGLYQIFAEIHYSISLAIALDCRKPLIQQNPL